MWWEAEQVDRKNGTEPGAGKAKQLRHSGDRTIDEFADRGWFGVERWQRRNDRVAPRLGLGVAGHWTLRSRLPRFEIDADGRIDLDRQIYLRLARNAHLGKHVLAVDHGLGRIQAHLGTQPLQVGGYHRVT